MSGVLFVICIPTETAERKLCGSDAAVTPTTSNYSGKCPDDTNSAAVPIVPMITLMPPPSVLGQPKPQHSAIADSAKRNSFGSQSPLLASGDMHVANERNMFQPTPKSSTVSGHGATAKKKAVSASALRDSAGSKETLVQIELGSDEYETQTTITSVDDIAVGMPVHLGGDSLKRTKSDNALASPNDDASLPNSNIRKSWDGYIKDLMLSAKKTKSPLHASTTEPSLNIENHSSMEMVMRELLKKMRISRSAVWQKDASGDAWQIMFSVDSEFAQERALTMLTEWGIGEREGSAVSMVPCTVLMHKPEPERDVDGEVLDEQEVYDKTANAWDRFMNSMRARLNVAQIVESVKQDATITFDFLSLLIIAAVLAAFGLVENSTIFLASSMLISPLMGPIIAATFGTVIKDSELTKFGIVNELIGILLTTAVGFVFGLIVFNVDDSFSRGEGLTQEMLSRTDTHSLIVGIFIAIPSGAAVAISILGENIGSLVGVAISASLLPPAVNSGLLWALAVMFMSHREDAEKYNTVIDSSKWSDHQAVELFVLGSISMAVTISNVICVYAAGTVFLKIKEVAPIVSREQRQFWKHDVKVARDYNNKAGGAGGSAGAASAGNGMAVGGSIVNADNSTLTQKWVDEFGDFAGTDVERLGLNAEMLRNVGRPAYQQTWSPHTLRHHQFHHANDSKRSLEEFEQMYMNMAHPVQGNPALARHFSISGPSKSVMYKRNSPPKYRSLLHDHIFNASAAAAVAQQRRSSMPYFISSSSPPAAPTMRFGSSVGRSSSEESTAASRSGKVQSTVAVSKNVSRLSNIPEVSSQGSPASTPRSVAGTSAQAGASNWRPTSPQPSTSTSVESHLAFERRAARASGRKFIVTPASVDPLLDPKNDKKE